MSLPWILRRGCLVLGATGLLLLTGCGSGSAGKTGATGATGAPGAAGEDAVTDPTTVAGDEDLPGVVLAITAVEENNAAVGDFLKVTFTCKNDAGANLDVSEFTWSEIIVAGPTANYQQILYVSSYSPNALHKKAVDNGDGTWTYTFATAIPATYPSQTNDTDGTTLTNPAYTGELDGQALQDGTYTVGIDLVKQYTITGSSDKYNDNHSATKDFLLGTTATTIQAREVVQADNCHQCHEKIYIHGGWRTGVKYCLLCHTSGAEDKNTTDAKTADGTVPPDPTTPGTSIDFRVMIHKIHNGKHLPSVNNVTNTAGVRTYGDPAAAPRYYVVGYGNTAHDFSNVAFPIWPTNLKAGLPADVGYDTLSDDSGVGGLDTGEKQDVEDDLRSGASTCGKCHSVTADANDLDGALAYSPGSKRACGSCHDDVVWGDPFSDLAGNVVMVAADTADETGCKTCHAPTRTAAADAAHKHPIETFEETTGLNFNITAVTPGGDTNGDGFVAGEGDAGTVGNVDTGEKMRITFTLKKNDGTTDTDPDDPTEGIHTDVRVVVNGPTSNPQLLVYANIPQADMGTVAAASYTFNVPEPVHLETNALVGTGGAQVITTGSQPIWANATTLVYERPDPADLGGAAANGTLVDAAVAGQNYVDITVAAGTFAAGEYIVIADGGAGVVGANEEVLQLKLVSAVDANSRQRLWFTSRYSTSSTSSSSVPPVLMNAHAAATAVAKVATGRGAAADELTSKTFDFSTGLGAPGGVITLTETVVAGKKILVSYTTDFVMPTIHPGQLNDAPGPLDPATSVSGIENNGLDASWGDWRGMAVQDGSYTVGIWAEPEVSVTRSNGGTNQDTVYVWGSPPATRDFLVGAATAIVPHVLIQSADKCYACHDDIQFHHGDRRGLETCLLCHGLPAAEDGAKYSYATNADTPGTTVDLRTMLHKIHMGEHLPSYEAKATEKGKVAVDPVSGDPVVPTEPLPYLLTDAEAAEAYNVASRGSTHTYQHVVFPPWPGYAKHCDKCHGTNTSWKAPADRDHTTGQTTTLGNLTREWRSACGSCHDGTADLAHIDSNTSSTGSEGCAVCHGSGKEHSVENVHKPRYGGH